MYRLVLLAVGVGSREGGLAAESRRFFSLGLHQCTDTPCTRRLRAHGSLAALAADGDTAAQVVLH